MERVKERIERARRSFGFHNLLQHFSSRKGWTLLMKLLCCRAGSTSLASTEVNYITLSFSFLGNFHSSSARCSCMTVTSQKGLFLLLIKTAPHTLWADSYETAAKSLPSPPHDGGSGKLHALAAFTLIEMTWIGELAPPQSFWACLSVIIRLSSAICKQLCIL